jgi:signal transduction histidine kinase
MFLVRDLVSPRTWLAMISHLAGLVIGFAVIFVFTFGLAFGFSLVVLALVGLPVLGVTLRFAEWFAMAERARFGFLLGVRIPAWPAGSSSERAGYRWGVVPHWRMFTERATWSEIGYGLLRLPVSAVAATVSVAAWAAGLVMLTLPLYNSLLPSGGAKIGDFVLGGTPRMTASAVIGLLVLLAAAQLTRGLALADAAMSRRLLGPRRDLAARVSELEVSRERVVDAAEAERRRIERDLHDGAQQQLVALAVKLRMVEQIASRDAARATALVAELQTDANDALQTLRDLAHGIYPPLLADKGIAAALEGQARRSPVPVTLEGSVGRHAPEMESALYFCCLEALQNVSKYARASNVTIRLQDGAGELRFEVCDDGAGFDTDAEAHGSGLQGMSDRLAALDGTLEVRSAPGAGTTVIGRVPLRAPATDGFASTALMYRSSVSPESATKLPHQSGPAVLFVVL